MLLSCPFAHPSSLFLSPFNLSLSLLLHDEPSFRFLDDIEQSSQPVQPCSVMSCLPPTSPSAQAGQVRHSQRPSGKGGKLDRPNGLDRRSNTTPAAYIHVQGQAQAQAQAQERGAAAGRGFHVHSGSCVSRVKAPVKVSPKVRHGWFVLRADALWGLSELDHALRSFSLAWVCAGGLGSECKTLE